MIENVGEKYNEEKNNFNKIKDKKFNYASSKLKIENMKDQFDSIINISEKHNERQMNRNKIKEHVTPSACFQHIDRTAQRNKKEHDREGYKMRKAPVGTPFYLISSNFQGNIFERLRIYNRTHKCKCEQGRRSNIITLDKTYLYFKVDCDHSDKNAFNENREIVDRSLGDRCCNCHSKRTYLIIRRNCDCFIIFCKECLYTVYQYKINNEMIESIMCVCQHPDDKSKHTIEPMVKEVVVNKTMEKSYAAVAKLIPKKQTVPAGLSFYKYSIKDRKKFLADIKVIEGNKQSFEDFLKNVNIKDRADYLTKCSEIIEGRSESFISWLSKPKEYFCFIIDFIKNLFQEKLTTFNKYVTQTVKEMIFDKLDEMKVLMITNAALITPQIITILHLLYSIVETDSKVRQYMLGYNIGILIVQIMNIQKYMTTIQEIASQKPNALSANTAIGQLIHYYQYLEKGDVSIYYAHKCLIGAVLDIKCLMKGIKENYLKIYNECGEKKLLADMLYKLRYVHCDDIYHLLRGEDSYTIFNGIKKRMCEANICEEEVKTKMNDIAKIVDIIGLEFYNNAFNTDGINRIMMGQEPVNYSDYESTTEGSESVWSTTDEETDNIDGQAQGFTYFSNNLSKLFEALLHFSSEAVNKTKLFFSLNLIRSFNTSMAGLRNVKNVFDVFVKFIPDFIKHYFNPYLTVDWLKNELRDPRSLASRLTEACLGIRVAVDSGEDREEIVKLKYKATELLTEFEMFIIENEVYKDQHLVKWLSIMRDLINSSLPALTRDREPFCVRISGPPGCGKSSYWTSIVSPLFQGLSAEEIEQMTYTRNPNTEFFDGLDISKHDILLYDDFLQGTEELDLTEIISVVSKSGFIPPMASVDTSKPELGFKGQPYAPSLVVLLSNLYKVTQATTIRFPEAIERRCFVNVEFPSFTTGSKTFDLNKIQFSVRTNGSIIVCDGIKQVHEVIIQAYERFEKGHENLKISRENYMYTGTTGRIINLAKPKPQLPSVKDRLEDKIINGSKQAGSSLIDKFLLFIKGIGNIPYWMRNGCVALRDFFMKPRFTEKQLIPILLATMGGGFLLGIYLRYAYGDVIIDGLKSIFGLRKDEEMYGEEQSGTTITRGGNKVNIISGVKQVKTPEYLSKNQCVIQVGSRKALGIFVKGRYLLTVRHLFLDYPLISDIQKRTVKLQSEMLPVYLQDTNMTMTFVNGLIVNDHYSKENIVELYNDNDDMGDLVLYRCSNNTPMRSDILNHFPIHDEVLKDKAIIFNSINNDTAKLVRHTLIHNDNFVLKYDVGDQIWLAAKSFSYRAETIVGDCGSFITTDTAQPQILGIHIGGFKGRDNLTYGVSTRVTRSLLLKALDKFDEEPSMVIGTPQLKIVESETSPKFGSRIEFIGKVEGVSAYPIGKTDLRPSPLHGLFPVTTQPSITNIYDKRLNGRNILLEGINKYGKNIPLFDNTTEKLVLQSFIDDFRGGNRTILTLDEAINGVEDINGMDMSTSPGYPYSCIGMGGNKRKFFDQIDGKYRFKEEYQQEYDEYESQLLQGNIIAYPWIDCLKDERRSIEKVKMGKTRVFSSASFFYILLFKRFYGRFLQHLNNSRFKTFYRVGMNKDSIEWDTHVRKLIEVGGDNLFDLDYHSMDGNNSIQNVNLFFDIADEWYSDEHTKIRRALREIESFAYHMYYDIDSRSWLLYRLIGGTNSGTLITIALNSISLEANLRRAWLHLVPHMRDLYYYKRFVRSCAMGDDGVVSCHNTIKEYFNYDNIKEYLWNFGIELTSGDKDEHSSFKNFQEIIFLKNKTGTLGNRFVPLMDFEAMVEPINWIRITNMVSKNQACEDNCNAVLRNSFWYGKRTFNSIRSLILEYAPGYNLLSYDYLQEEYYGSGTLVDILSLNGKKTKNDLFTLTL